MKLSWMLTGAASIGVAVGINVGVGTGVESGVGFGSTFEVGGNGVGAGTDPTVAVGSSVGA